MNNFYDARSGFLSHLQAIMQSSMIRSYRSFYIGPPVETVSEHDRDPSPGGALESENA